ncbi:hypothetical protein LJR219_000667 [Phenylobacterium sp. LjRoot219]|uniref:hypothetical protein n=1 Tax=Phenylobacterium sp. LjRoot219 TaxID=3342283 RepID=UPI003ED0BE9B
MSLERIAARLILFGLVVVVGFLLLQLARKADHAYANRQTPTAGTSQPAAD